MKEPKSIIKDGIVVNADQLKRYYRDHPFKPRFTDEDMIDIGRARERLEARMVRAYYPVLPKDEPQPQVIEYIHRHSDMSKKDFAQLQSLIGEVKYLEKLLNKREVGKQGVKYTIRT